MRRSREHLLFALSILTVCFIWGNSLLPGSTSSAFSDWVGALLSRILGDVMQTESGHGILRKLAHGTEYLVLGAELWALLRYLQNRPWSTVALGGMSVALLDETIQLFVEGRSGAIRDVWIDLSGFFVGCVICTGVLALRKRRKQP